MSLYALYGWRGVCLLGAGFGVLTLGMSASDALRTRAAHASGPQPGSARERLVTAETAETGKTGETADPLRDPA